MITIDNITLTLIVFSSIYFLSTVYLLRQRHPETINGTKKRRVSVLIAARNEEKYLQECLSSLARQNYDKKLYTVTILDDNSGDNTAEIAKSFCTAAPNFHYRHITDTIGDLKGKMNVLAQGLLQQKSDIILITDADCIVPSTWIETMVSYFDESTGLVSALTSLSPLEWTKVHLKNKLFHKIQTLDWFFLQAVAKLSSNAGRPITVLGNNFAFSLKAYKESGGFEKMGFSITEDYALLRAIDKTKKWKIKHINDKNATIFSYPLDSVKSFILQRLRWIKGGKSARPWAYFLMTTSFITHLLILSLLILAPLNMVTLLSSLLIFLIDFQIIMDNINRSNLRKLLPYFILFELFYIIYTVLFAFYFILPLKIEWKNRKL